MINEPQLCVSSLWHSDGITFADESTIGDYPTTVVVNKNNVVFIVATNLSEVQMWSEGAGNSTEIISNDLENPYGLALSKYGDVIIDNGYAQNFVEKWSPKTLSSTIVMTVNESCYGLFVDQNDTLYCSLTNLHQIVKSSVNLTDSLPILVAGNGTAGIEMDLLNRPHGIYVDKEYRLYIADTDNDRIQLFEKNALVGQTIVDVILSRPTGVILDQDENLFIADTNNNRIIRSDRIGFRCIIGCTGTSGSNADQLNKPSSISFDKQGNLFVVDFDNHRIQKFILATNSCSECEINKQTNFFFLLSIRSSIQSTGVVLNSYVGSQCNNIC